MSRCPADSPTAQTEVPVRASEPGTIKRVSAFGVGRGKKERKEKEIEIKACAYPFLWQELVRVALCRAASNQGLRQTPTGRTPRDPLLPPPGPREHPPCTGPRSPLRAALRGSRPSRQRRGKDGSETGKA